MSKVSQKVLFVLFLSCLLALVFSNIFVFSDKKAFAEDDGLNFIANCPTQTTQYQRGEGTVTFVPEVNGRASITLNNATIYANQKVTYWSLNYTYAVGKFVLFR